VLDQEENANGWGMIFGAGIDLDPIYIGMKYETETSLDFRYKIKQDTVTGLPYGLGQTRGIVNGAEHERNLPALFSIGLAYTVSPKLKIDAGLIYYFHEDAGWGGDEQFAENGWEAALSIEYRFNDNIKGSIGYLHTSTGMDAQHALKEAPELDADSYGAGVVYQVNEGIRIDLGAALVDYKSGSYVDTSSGSALLIGLNKEVIMFSAGIQYCF
jgi:long-chain fatty acid transport protein